MTSERAMRVLDVLFETAAVVVTVVAIAVTIYKQAH